MTDFLYAFLGYAIIFLLIFVTSYGAYLSMMRQRLLLAVLVLFAVFFTTIFGIIANTSCTCLLGNDIFRDITKFFMEDILPLAGNIVMIIIFLIALRAFLLGERSLAPGILLNVGLNLLAASFWALIFSSIITFYACPLICEHYLDLNEAHQNMVIAIRRWLGTGLE